MRVLGGIVIGVVIVLSWQHVTVRGQAAAPYGSFSGAWSFHGGTIQVSPSGKGKATFRTYITCTNSIQTACDRFIGNTIYNGGYLRFHLTSVSGNVAHGKVTGSAFSWQVDTPVRVTRRTNDTILLKAPGMSQPACGPHAPAGTCGA